MKPKKRTDSIVLLAWVCAMFHWSSASSQDVQAFNQKLVEYFSAFHMLPFPVWEGQRVGDALDLRDLSVLKSAENCFKAPIQVRKVSQEHLPQVLEIDSQSGFLDAVLNRLIGVSLKGQGISKAAIAFDDVTIETTTFDTLKVALLPACSELEAMFKNRQYPKVDGRASTVVLGILRARPTIALGLEGGGDVNAHIAGIKSLLKDRAGVIDLDPRVAAGYQLQKFKAISMTSSVAVTVAYKPASIPAYTLGSGQKAQVVPFDETNHAHVETLQRVGTAWAKQAAEQQWVGLFAPK